jgi:hypothetical protein
MFFTQRRKGTQRRKESLGNTAVLCVFAPLREKNCWAVRRDRFAVRTKRPHRGFPKEAQKTERFSGLICALLAVMATEGTKHFIHLFIHILVNQYTFVLFVAFFAAFVI